jgi:ABC-type Mn2+/Zn2+ transport system permease subunit
MGAAKIGLIVIWVFCGACVLSGSQSTAVSVGRMTFWAMAIAHVVEFGVFSHIFRRAEGGLASHFTQTLAFGLFHVREVRMQVEASEGS